MSTVWTITINDDEGDNIDFGVATSEELATAYAAAEVRSYLRHDKQCPLSPKALDAMDLEALESLYSETFRGDLDVTILEHELIARVEQISKR